MKLKSYWLSPILGELQKSEGGIKAFQGSAYASIVLVSPIPNEASFQSGIPWCDQSAKYFFNWTIRCFDLGSTDFLVMPCTFDGKKPVKGNTRIGHRTIELAAKRKSITHFVCVGGDAFKTYFGYGKKPSMNALAGNSMYLPQVNHKPVFVFPDIDWLNFDPDAKYETKRDWAIANHRFNDAKILLESLKLKFERFLKTRKI